MVGMGVGSPDLFGAFVHEQIGRTISQLDSKVTINLGLASGALVYLASEMEVQSTILELLNLQGMAKIDLTEVISFVSAVLLAISFLAAFSCILPRFGSVKGSLVFYSAIARVRTADEYSDTIAGSSEGELVQAILRDTHALARIAAAKAFYASWSSVFLIAGLATLIGAVIVRPIIS